MENADKDEELGDETMKEKKYFDAAEHPKRRYKSVVDDQFFSLAEMESFLQNQEEGEMDRDQLDLIYAVCSFWFSI